MTREQAEKATGLVSREFPASANVFLACQLGKWVIEPIMADEDILANGKPVRLKVPMTVTRFHLLGMGESWKKAFHSVGRP